MDYQIDLTQFKKIPTQADVEAIRIDFKKKVEMLVEKFPEYKNKNESLQDIIIFSEQHISEINITEQAKIPFVKILSTSIPTKLRNSIQELFYELLINQTNK